MFDTTGGPVVLESGVEVKAPARLEGPLWVGANTRLLGGPIRGSAIGPWSVARGELATTVFLGYANKSHDGFVGHSVLGRWVNLGAGTITSNLKNTYGPVRLDIAGATLETGHMFLGSLIGDHAKTAIGTLLGTGTVVGAGANLFEGVRAPKYVAPFSWGGGGSERMTKAALKVQLQYDLKEGEITDFLLQAADFGRKELHRAATLGADHVVVAAAVVLVFVAGNAIVEGDFAGQSAFS